MAKSHEVLGMLIPDGGYVQTGEAYEDIEFISCKPITKAQYEAGFAQFDAWKAQDEETKQTAKEEVLAKLGLTAEEVTALLA